MNQDIPPPEYAENTIRDLKRAPDKAVWGFPIRLVLLGLAAVPVLALIGALAYDTYRQYIVAVQDAYRLSAIVRSTSGAQTEHFLSRANFILTTLAQRPEIKSLDPARCDPLLAELKQLQPDYANLLTLNIECPAKRS